jgi:hypothetical protein
VMLAIADILDVFSRHRPPDKARIDAASRRCDLHH